jgi:osmotically-inducible protein OsmY
MIKIRHVLIVSALAFAFCPQAVNAMPGDAQELKQPGVSTPEDQEITSNVKAALQNSTSLGQAVSGVNFEVKQGVVTLTGVVASADEKTAIEQEVSKCSGVAQVKNQITSANS